MKKKDKIKLYIILVLAVSYLTLIVVLKTGVFKNDERKVYDKTKSDSVLKLVGNLENFVPLQIDSCDYEVCSEVIKSGLPAPSNTKVIIKGSAILSERGMQAFRDNYSFEDVDHANLPTELMPLLPNENLIYSKEFNETFSKNPWLWDGFVVLIKGDTTNKIFFITCDNNHGLEFNTQ